MKDKIFCHSPLQWFINWIGKSPSDWTDEDFNNAIIEFNNEFGDNPTPPPANDVVERFKKDFFQKNGTVFVKSKDGHYTVASFTDFILWIQRNISNYPRAVTVEEIKEAVEKFVGKSQDCPNCNNEGFTVVQTQDRSFVTRDMAIDAGDPTLEGSVYSEEEFEQEQCQWCYCTINSKFNVEGISSALHSLQLPKGIDVGEVLSKFKEDFPLTKGVPGGSVPMKYNALDIWNWLTTKLGGKGEGNEK